MAYGNRNAEVDFRGERRSNATHALMTDSEARLFKKSPGAGAMLCFMGHSLQDMRRVPPSVRRTCRLRSGLIVQADLTRADGHVSGVLPSTCFTATRPDRSGA